MLALLIAPLIWHEPCGFKTAAGAAHPLAAVAEHCDYLRNKKLDPAMFGRKTPEEQEKLLQAADMTLREYSRRRKEVLAGESLPAIRTERDRAAAVFGRESGFLKEFDKRKTELETAEAAKRTQEKLKTSGAQKMAGKNAEAGAREGFDKNSLHSTRPPLVNEGRSVPDGGNGQLAGAAMAGKSNNRFYDSIDEPPPVMVRGPDGKLSDTRGIEHRAKDAPEAFKPDPNDKGAQNIDRVYRSVYNQHGSKKLGTGAMGSRVGNMVDIAVDSYAEAKQEPTLVGKAGGYVLTGLLAVPAGAGLAVQATKDWVAPPEIPEGDPDIQVPTRKQGKYTEGPFMICSDWQDAISKTSADPRNKLDFGEYKMSEQSGKVGMLGTTHHWVNYTNCRSGTIVIADPWLYGKDLKQVPITQENAAYYAPSGTGCP